MSALSITANSVVKSTGAALRTEFVAGEAVTAGQSVYLKTSDSKWWLAQADGTAEESGSGTILGVALNAAAAGQPVIVQTGGTITIGATVAAGVFYYLGATAGGIYPVGDLSSTNYVSTVGYGASTTTLIINPVPTGKALA